MFSSKDSARATRRKDYCLSPSDIQSGSKIPGLPHVLRPAQKSNQLLTFFLTSTSHSTISKQSNGVHMLPGPEPIVWLVRFWPDHLSLGAHPLLVNQGLGIGICNETAQTKRCDYKY